MVERNPINNESFIELRVAYPTHARLSLVNGLNKSCSLNRLNWIGDLLYDRRDRLADGTQEQVYRLPTTVDTIYEIAQTVSGQRRRRYVAIWRGALYRITRDAVERMAEGSMTLRQWTASIADHQHGDVL